MHLPQKKMKGDIIQADEYNILLDYVASITPHTSDTVRVNHTTRGTTFNALPPKNTPPVFKYYPPFWPIVSYDDTNAIVKFIPGAINGIIPNVNGLNNWNEDAYLTISVASNTQGIIYALMDEDITGVELFSGAVLPADTVTDYHIVTHSYYTYDGLIHISPLFTSSIYVQIFEGGLYY